MGDTFVSKQIQIESAVVRPLKEETTGDIREHLLKQVLRPEAKIALATSAPTGTTGDADKQKALNDAAPLVQATGAATGYLRSTLPWTSETVKLTGPSDAPSATFRNAPQSVRDITPSVPGAHLPRVEAINPLKVPAGNGGEFQISEATQRLLAAQRPLAEDLARANPGRFLTEQGAIPRLADGARADAVLARNEPNLAKLNALEMPAFRQLEAKNFAFAEGAVIERHFTTPGKANAAALIGAVGVNMLIDAKTPRQATVLSEVADFITPIGVMGMRMTPLGKWAPAARAAIIVGEHAYTHFMVDEQVVEAKEDTKPESR